MKRGQSRTARARMAAPASFLLFAALLGVTRADASLTKPADVADLSRPALQLPTVASTEPSRFGFAEDLTLLNVEKEAPRFSLIEGVEMRRFERTYARNNPLRFTDPTGLYTVGCALVEISCANNATAFENARQDALKSKDSAVVAGANAYGAAGVENGVTVSFANPGSGRAGTMSPDVSWDAGSNSMKLSASVVIRPGQQGTELASTVAHEGTHLADAQRFVASFTPELNYNRALNPTQFQTELNAYRVTHKLFDAANSTFRMDCPGCTLGRGVAPGQVDEHIRSILASPIYGLSPTSPGSLLFPNWP